MLTLEAITAELEQQPELKTTIISSLKDEFLKGITAEGYIVRTRDEEAAFLESHNNLVLPNLVKKGVGEQFGQALNSIDAELQKIYGIDKKPGEKTTDFAARAAAEHKAKGGDPLTKEQVKQLQTLVEQKDREKAELEQSLTKKLFDYQINAQLDQALGSANFFVPPHLKTAEEKEAYVQMQKSLIRNDYLKSYAAKNGENESIVFYEGETPLINQTNGKPKAASDIISERYASFFATGQTVKTGTGITGVDTTSGKLTSTDAIHKNLAAKGLEAGQPEYLKEFEALKNEAGL